MKDSIAIETNLNVQNKMGVEETSNQENIRRLPDTELEVMQAVWSCKPPVARVEIEEILYKSHPMAATTLLTLLSRLSEKDFLEIEKKGRKSYYKPRISQEDYQAVQSKIFFEKVCRSRMSAFAAALCRSGISKENLSELRGLLEKNEV